jgi:methionyl aminopeptidase
MGEGAELKEGMFFTIEPMINLGKAHVKVLSDGWTAVTRDRSLSAQFEQRWRHQEGCEIFPRPVVSLPALHGVGLRGLDEAS